MKNCRVIVLFLFAIVAPLRAIVIDVNQETVDQLIKGAVKPIIIYFYSRGCKVCQGVDPIFTKVSHEWRDKYVFARTDPKDVSFARSCGVRSFPFFIIIYKGDIVGRIPGGPVSEQEFKRVIGSAIDRYMQAYEDKKTVRGRLLHAIVSGTVDELSAVIKEEPDLNEPFDNGKTPLMLAIQYAYIRPDLGGKKLRLLLESTDILDAIDNESQRAQLHGQANKAIAYSDKLDQMYQRMVRASTVKPGRRNRVIKNYAGGCSSCGKKRLA